ncbi:dnaJ homolog subfamily C member 12 [Gracilinanus agilis]|uniref:dnaJ homolog subfamily C member 12 n=1 Tax=Gracilinanus agilis TaxID=191870 RepID=UPI001CFEA85E|nr:dnaJ homolog subfamily C member 12 [Gracilinanus agilis]
MPLEGGTHATAGAENGFHEKPAIIKGVLQISEAPNVYTSKGNSDVCVAFSRADLLLTLSVRHSIAKVCTNWAPKVAPRLFCPCLLYFVNYKSWMVENFQRLQKAKDILTNEESRDRYDYWRRSRIPIPFHQWEALSNSVKTSMHWAVRSKKEKMLEESDSADTANAPEDEGSQQKTSRKELGSATERKDQGKPDTLDKTWSPQSPDSSNFPDVNCWHLRFRWSGDTPSDLLRKFRNYEI